MCARPAAPFSTKSPLLPTPSSTIPTSLRPTGPSRHLTLAGRLAVFGHQTCVGDEGHCEVPTTIGRFDDRPSHQLTRAFKRIVVTDALLRCLVGGPDLTVTIVMACDPGTKMTFNGPLLDIQGLQLTTFA